MDSVRTSILEDLDPQLKTNASDRPTLSTVKSPRGCRSFALSSELVWDVSATGHHCIAPR